VVGSGTAGAKEVILSATIWSVPSKFVVNIAVGRWPSTNGVPGQSRLFGDGLHGGFSFFDHPYGDYTNRSITQDPSIMNESTRDVEGFPCR